MGGIFGYAQVSTQDQSQHRNLKKTTN